MADGYTIQLPMATRLRWLKADGYTIQVADGYSWLLADGYTIQ
jgi:hypothetical protein